MDDWSEIRTAYAVAKLGTVSAAADALGVHRATVNRHVETLENRLNVKLFYKHARGYEPTGAGLDLLEVAGRADELFADLTGRLKGQASTLTGALTLTALGGVTPLIMPSINAFREHYPDIDLRLIAEERLLKLEHGEAHIAIRAGKKPEEPDYVVIPFRKENFSIYASRSYIEKHGKPNAESLSEHAFIGSHDGPMALPCTYWLQDNIPKSCFAIDTSEPVSVIAGVQAGIGIGFIADFDAALRQDLVNIFSPDEDMSIKLWIVSHIDSHRTAKVQAFVQCLKANRSWSTEDHANG